MENPKITLELLCQDEEEMIGQSIRFLLKLADAITYPVEFVIVDGGSEDGTMKIINDLKDKRFKVIENAWPGFAAQRNVAFSASSGEWVFTFAPDEVCSDEIYERINPLINNEEAFAYWFPGIDLIGDLDHMRVDITDAGPKLKRNLKGPKGFQYISDNQGTEYTSFDGKELGGIRGQYKPGIWVSQAEVKIVHFHCLKSVEARVKRTMVYTKLSGPWSVGWDEERVRQRIEYDSTLRTDLATGELFYGPWKACLISDYFKDLTFYTELR